MSNLIESKSLLAKLMATENLTIEQKNIPTAMFDVKNRILTVPVLDEKITPFEYDLFMGHEVGHALYTPMEGMIKGREEKIPPSILNVVEDVRIERKIKNKYPGLRSSFIRAYNGLCEKDFFATKGVDLNEMNFIDRLNLYTKVGVTLGIKFDDEEKVLLKDSENTETYDDVIELAKRIYEFMKLKDEERKAAQPPEEIEEEEIEEEGDGFGNHDDFLDDWEESEDSKNKPESGMNEVADSAEGLEDFEDINHNDDFSYKPVEKDNVRAFTDEAFKQNEKKLFAENSKNWVYVNVPKIDTKKAIFPHKELYKKYREHVSEYYWKGVDVKKFQKLRLETNKVVSYLAKEFELRKNAEQLKRASTAKTGEIDMKRIFSYQFSEDIFKKISVVPNGKSHGLVMFLDWSGSMTDHLENTVKQLLSLVMFCKKVSIPYEVYCFADCDSNDARFYRPTPKEGDIWVRDFQLLNILSSTMSAGEFNYAASALVYMSGSPRYCPHWMQLSGTPLSEAVMSAIEIVPQFQKQYKLQIVNTVFLTDGEGHQLSSVWKKDDKGVLYGERVDTPYSHTYRRSDCAMVIRDPITKNEERTNNIYSSSEQTSALIKLLKARTGCNVLGFYVISGREFGKKCYDFYPRTSNFETIKTNFRKNKYAVVTTSAFDEYYILRSEGLDTDEDSTFEVKENATTRGLVSAFSKYAGGRVTNRIVLNRFIGLVS
jgi:hypothetical protein